MLVALVKMKKTNENKNILPEDAQIDKLLKSADDAHNVVKAIQVARKISQ